MASSLVMTLTETAPVAPSSSSVPVATEPSQSFEPDPLVRDPQKGKAVLSEGSRPAASSRRASVVVPDPEPTPSWPSTLDMCMSEICRISRLSFDEVDFGQYSKLLEHTLVSFPDLASDARDNLKKHLRLARKIERELPIQKAAQAEGRKMLQSLPDPVAVRADLEARLAEARHDAEAARLQKEFVLAELTGCQKSLSLKEDQLALLDRSISLIGPDGHYTEEAIAEKASHHALFFKHQHFSHAAKAIARTLDLYSDKYKKMIGDLSAFANAHASRENPSDPPPE